MARTNSTDRAAAQTLASLMGLRLDAKGRCMFRLGGAQGINVQVHVVDVPKQDGHGDGQTFKFMDRAARCFSFDRPRDFYLVLTRPDVIRNLTGCAHSDFCFGTEREALAFVRKIDERTYGSTLTIQARPKESFDCLPNFPFGAYAIPVYVCDHQYTTTVVGYVFTCGFEVFHLRRLAVLDAVHAWESRHGFPHMTYSFPEATPTTTEREG